MVCISFLAENFLLSVETNKGYGLLLLHLIARDTVDLTIRVAAAITFKNYVKRNWKIVSRQFLNKCVRAVGKVFQNVTPTSM